MSATSRWLVRATSPGWPNGWSRRSITTGAAAVTLPHVVAQSLGDHALFDGRLDEAQRWYEQAHRLGGRRSGLRRSWPRARSSLARTYAGDPTAAETAATLLATVADGVTPLGRHDLVLRRRSAC